MAECQALQEPWEAAVTTGARWAQASQVRQLRVDFWGLALSGANKINGLMVPSCPNLRSLVVARRYKNTSDMKVF
jgi:hypothetical protein